MDRLFAVFREKLAQDELAFGPSLEIVLALGRLLETRGTVAESEREARVREYASRAVDTRLRVERLRNTLRPRRLSFSACLSVVAGAAGAAGAEEAEGERYASEMPRRAANRHGGFAGEELRLAVDGLLASLRKLGVENDGLERQLRDSFAETKRRLSDTLAKYDSDVGRLHASRKQLVRERELVSRERQSVQHRLTVQRVLHKRVREERSIAEREAFLENVEKFRRNRAARVVQRKWRAHCSRVASRKRKYRRKFRRLGDDRVGKRVKRSLVRSLGRSARTNETTNARTNAMTTATPTTPTTGEKSRLSFREERERVLATGTLEERREAFKEDEELMRETTRFVSEVIETAASEAKKRKVLTEADELDEGSRLKGAGAIAGWNHRARGFCNRILNALCPCFANNELFAWTPYRYRFTRP